MAKHCSYKMHIINSINVPLETSALHFPSPCNYRCQKVDVLSWSPYSPLMPLPATPNPGSTEWQQSIILNNLVLSLSAKKDFYKQKWNMGGLLATMAHYLHFANSSADYFIILFPLGMNDTNDFSFDPILCDTRAGNAILIQNRFWCFF